MTTPSSNPTPSDDPTVHAALAGLRDRMIEDIILEYAAGLYDGEPEVKAATEEILRTLPEARAFYDRYTTTLASRSREQWGAEADRVLVHVFKDGPEGKEQTGGAPAFAVHSGGGANETSNHEINQAAFEMTEFNVCEQFEENRIEQYALGDSDKIEQARDDKGFVLKTPRGEVRLPWLAKRCGRNVHMVFMVSGDATLFPLLCIWRRKDKGASQAEIESLTLSFADPQATERRTITMRSDDEGWEFEYVNQ